MHAGRLGMLLLALGCVCMLAAACGSEETPSDKPPAWSYGPDGQYTGPPVDRSNLPNLVVLMVDTLRSDCVGSGPGEPADMPFVSGLAGKGVRCTQATAPSPLTLPSITSFLTGLLPDRHRVDFTPYPILLAPGTTTFAEALSKGHGYETAAITELRWHPAQPDASPYQGMTTVRCGGPLRWAREQIPAWNAARDKARPFFLFLHTYETHDPYGEANHPWPPGPPTEGEVQAAPGLSDVDDATFAERFLLDRGTRLTWLMDDSGATLNRAYRYFGKGYAAAPKPELAAKLERAYRGGVTWVDREVEKTVAVLKAQGLLENTLLVVTADHGEAFGEHGLLHHGRSLHEEMLHIPLVAVGPPPFDQPAAPGTSLGLIDVIPTFFELAGLPALGGVSGRSMLRALRTGHPGRAVISVEHVTTYKMGQYASAQVVSARTATESFILTFDVAAGTVIERYYDRARDPREQHDLAVDGRLGRVPVTEPMAQAIALVRDRIWAGVSSNREHGQMGYGAGVGTVTSKRPPPPNVRAP